MIFSDDLLQNIKYRRLLVAIFLDDLLKLELLSCIVSRIDQRRVQKVYYVLVRLSIVNGLIFWRWSRVGLFGHGLTYRLNIIASEIKLKVKFLYLNIHNHTNCNIMLVFLNKSHISPCKKRTKYHKSVQN